MRKKQMASRPIASDPSVPKYSIAVAADLSGVPQQQLRRMEEEGLVAPERTPGNTRRYSDSDLMRIAAAAELAEQGVNAAGIRAVIEQQAIIQALQRENERLRQQLADFMHMQQMPVKKRGRRARVQRPDR